MNVTFDHSEPVTDNIRTFWFKPEKSVQYIAGQFTQIYLPHPGADDRGEKRWFTLSSSPTEPMVGISTKFAAEHGSSFKQALSKLEPGTNLSLADPMGDFVLPKDPSIPIVFVAAGMGITPMRSMIKYLVDTGEKRDIQLIYATSLPEEQAFVQLFKEYFGNSGKLTQIVKQPGPDWHGLTGSLSAKRIVELSKPAPNALVYISGPEPMIETFFKELQELGINKEQLVTDYFPGYTQF